MDLLSQHEAFLRAIFDAPEDDTHRLVYADFLEENGEPDRAHFIRVSCEHQRLLRTAESPADRVRLQQLIAQRLDLQTRLAESQPQLYCRFKYYDRGFPACPRRTSIPVSVLTGFDGPREVAVTVHPELFTMTTVRFTQGEICNSEQVRVLFESPVFARVTKLDLQGEEEYSDVLNANGQYFIHIPVISLSGVEALVQHEGVSRLSQLDLQNNNLGDDAAWAIIRSPHLENLKRLRLSEGNGLSDGVWQRLVSRFGEALVV